MACMCIICASKGLPELKKTVAAIRPILDAGKGKLKWVNLGGGHMITSPDYDRDGLVDFYPH